MFKHLENFLIDWKRETTDRQKLQSVYLAVAVAVLVIAGLISLIDADLGQKISFIAGFAFMGFIANAVVWSLFVTNLVDRIKDRRRQVK